MKKTQYLTSGAITCSTVVDIKEASWPVKISRVEWSLSARKLFGNTTLRNRGSVLELTLPSSVSIFPYVQGPAERSITTNLNGAVRVLDPTYTV